MTSTYFWLGASPLCASADADRAGGPTDLSRCASQPKALIPCAIELPWPDGLLAGHHSVHWRVLQPVKAKHKAWAKAATLAAGLVVPDTGDIRVSATYYPPNKRGDRVNYPILVKPYWDGIAEALGVNDRRFLPAFYFAEPVKNPRVVVSIG